MQATTSWVAQADFFTNSRKSKSESLFARIVKQLGGLTVESDPQFDGVTSINRLDVIKQRGLVRVT